MKFIVTSICPYCGHVVKYTVKKEYKKSIVICNTDEGGCDRYYVSNSYVEVKCETFKIEKINEKD